MRNTRFCCTNQGGYLVVIEHLGHMHRLAFTAGINDSIIVVDEQDAAILFTNNILITDPRVSVIIRL